LFFNWCALSTLQVRLLIQRQVFVRNAANTLNPGANFIFRLVISEVRLTTSTALAEAGLALPTGWLWGDGGTYSRTTYANRCGSHCNADGPHLYRIKQHLGLVRQPCRKASKAVEGAGIPTSTTVVRITSTTIVISQNANANNSSASLRICPWGNGDGSTTFNVPDRRYRTPNTIVKIKTNEVQVRHI